MEMIRRHASAVATELLGAFPSITIQGARQVGKSTLARQIVADVPHRIVTLDDESTRAAAEADEIGFVEQFPAGTLVIDEVQRRPEILLAVKASIDRDRRPGRFILTGSADLLAVKGRTDSLAGRTVSLDLRGFSQGEVSGSLDDFVASAVADLPLPEQSEWRRPDYARALGRGSYPEMQELTPRLRNVWIDSYVDRVLQRDAVVLPSGGQSSRIRSLLNVLAANQSGELVKARMAEETQVPANSIGAYLDVLRSVHLVGVLPPWTANLTKREVGRSKAFVEDSAVALRATRQTATQLEDLTSDSMGGLFEAFVVTELLKQRLWSREDCQLFHFRDRNGAEVDIVIELDDGRVIGIEVKSAASYRADHFKGLRLLQNQLGGRFVAGFVLGMATTSYRYAPGLYGLPASALWEWGA